MACSDQPGVQPIPNALTQCLQTLTAPDVLILSKPETFDSQGDISGYLKAQRYALVQTLPAFTIWRRSGQSVPLKR